MKRLPLRWIMACTLLALTACASRTDQDDPTIKNEPRAADPKLVGIVSSIPADQKFVLIQSYGKWKVAAGTVLTTRGADNRSANLLVTGESLGEFAAADLQSGSVERGDAVYSRHAPKPEEPLAGPSPEAGPPATIPELPKP